MTSSILITLVSFPTRQVRQELTAHGIEIVGVALVALLVVRIVDHAIPPAIGRVVMRDATPDNRLDLRKRADTLAGVLGGAARLLVLLVALLLVADELGVNVVPVIAGLGIGGIAIGLGAQSLVRDAINGMLILTENQYGKGDLITIAGVQGWVEEVNLRRTVLRDIDGTLHSVPNGEIKVASNLTRGFSGINLLIPVAVHADVDRAIELIDRTGHELVNEDDLGADILEAPHAARVEGPTAAGLEVRVIGRVAPGAQWRVSSALRRRLIKAFEAEGIRFGPIQSPPPPAPR